MDLVGLWAATWNYKFLQNLLAKSFIDNKSTAFRYKFALGCVLFVTVSSYLKNYGLNCIMIYYTKQNNNLYFSSLGIEITQSDPYFYLFMEGT